MNFNRISAGWRAAPNEDVLPSVPAMNYLADAKG